MRIAIDTNFLIFCCVKQLRRAIHAHEVLSKLEPKPEFLIPPTVGREFKKLFDEAPAQEKSEFLRGIRLARERRFELVPPKVITHWIPEAGSKELREKGVLPEAERNDGLILIEASLLHCELLVTDDPHLWKSERAKREAVLWHYGKATVPKSIAMIIQEYGGVRFVL
ncbi:MAG: type II toxin-antitoxin system VapC family toxin [Verrucomicrobiales bacterium]